jgi:succinate-semialdehyde dehydrogenase / glutarate-semialdehyde dehydrogenase
MSEGPGANRTASFTAIDPTNGEVIAIYEGHGAAEVERRLALAADTFRTWRETPFAERAASLRRVAERLRSDKGEHGLLMTREMGKPIGAAEAEAEKCAWVCDYYAEHAEAFLSMERVETDAAESGVRFDPLGPILAVMPWNFPYWQVLRFAAPALMAGNVALLKHASNVPGCALAIETLFRDAGLPDGAFQTLLVGSGGVAGMIADPRVAAVTLTGSEKAGQSVATEAGRHLKKCVLELGGSDPFIVLADADPAATAAQAAVARTINSGQSCIAAKRFIVEQPLAEPFTEELVRAMESLVVGDPKDRANAVGPMARRDLRDELHDQVQRSVAAGSRLRTGGAVPDGEGAYYPPTVLDRVRPGQPAFEEELFGPVAAVIEARDRNEAVALANASPYGLGASLWTGDAAGVRDLIPRIEAGAVFVNGIVKSDPRLPFGGVKRSGYGRELGIFGIREFVNVKSYWVGG